MNENDVIVAGLFAEARNHRLFNRLEQARRCLDEILSLAPDYVPAWNEKALIHMTLGELREATACFEKILELSPLDPYATNRLGVIYRETGETEAAIASFERGLTNNRYNSHILSELGLTYHQLGDSAREAHYFREAEKNRNLGNQISSLVADLATRITPGVVLAGLAHEAGNSLEIIDLAIDLSRRSLRAPEPDMVGVSTRLDLIAESAQRINKLIKHFRKLASKEPRHSDEVYVHQVIEFAFDLLGRKLANRDIEWQIIKHPGADSVSICCNQLELEQVFVNLISNSYDALVGVSDRAPKIIVEIEVEHGRAIIIRFSDNGSGIPVEIAPRIFDFLFSSKHGGTGIGLWLCAFAIEKAGGRIELAPQTENGATFLINLPLKEIESAKAPSFGR